MSLKSNLQQLIKDRNGGIVSLYEIEQYCHKAHYKTSNAERRLRRSESPHIIPVYNEKHSAIVGYKYDTKNQQKENSVKQIEKTPFPSDSETGSGTVRPLWNNGGTISGPYISHRPIPQNGVDDN